MSSVETSICPQCKNTTWVDNPTCCKDHLELYDEMESQPLPEPGLIACGNHTPVTKAYSDCLNCDPEWGRIFEPGTPTPEPTTGPGVCPSAPRRIAPTRVRPGTPLHFTVDYAEFEDLRDEVCKLKRTLKAFVLETDARVAAHVPDVFYFQVLDGRVILFRNDVPVPVKD